MALINCPECGKEVSDRATVCPNCAFPLEEYTHRLIKCPKCEKKILDTEKVCPNCGFPRADSANKLNELSLKCRIDKDIPNMRKYLRQAAELGNPGARYELGRSYYHGWGVPQDLEEAADWVLKAAEQGYKYAQERIALFYMYGKGVPRNLEKAKYWLSRLETPDPDFYERTGYSTNYPYEDTTGRAVFLRNCMEDVRSGNLEEPSTFPF